MGDKVFVDNTVLKTYPDAHDSDLPQKLRSKFTGPFSITEKSDNGVNYTLAMPLSYKGDHTFHVSLLRLKKSIPTDTLQAPIPEVGAKKYKDGTQLSKLSLLSVTVVSVVSPRKTNVPAK